MQKFILSVTVQNNAGVLARVSSLFGRRGYNIDSLTVSATTDPKISRMSIIVQGDRLILDQIIKQLLKLEEVIRVDHLLEDDSCCSELVFVKLRAESRRARRDSSALRAVQRERHCVRRAQHDRRAFRCAEPHRRFPRCRFQFRGHRNEPLGCYSHSKVM